MSDLIRREEVVEHFRRLKEASETNGQYNEGFVDGLDFCITFISTLPSAEPERKKGKWEVQPSTGEDRPFIWWKCSECGHVIFSETERDRKEFHAFCGRCGAEMTR